MASTTSPSAEAQPRLAIHGLGGALAGPFDLTLAPGRCAVIVGASGSGKSLFLRMIADLDPCDGAVALDGRDRALFSAPDWRRAAVYVAAEAGWWDPQVAAHFPAAQRDGARALAERLGLAADLLEAEVARLSTGEKQRLALVRALVLDSPLLLLDEPTDALDQASVGQVEQVLRERLARGTAVVMVTHDDALGGRLGHQQYRMVDRRLTAR